MNASRRGVLSICTTLALSGCLDVVSETDDPADTDNDGVPNREDLYPNDPLRSEDASIQSPGAITIESGDYYRIPLASTKARPMTVEYTVESQSGLAVNVFLIERDEYRQYASSENFEYYPEESRLVTTRAEVTFSIRETDYFLIIEHPESDVSLGEPINVDVMLNAYY